MRVNLMGSVWCTRHALPAIRASKGQLVAVCSLAGRLGLPQRSAYCTSKFAQDGFFNALRSELDSTGVTVTVAYPGFVASGFSEHSLDRDGNPGGVAAINPSSAMSIETCAELILQAMADRRSEVVMPPRGRFALWLKRCPPPWSTGCHAAPWLRRNRRRFDDARGADADVARGRCGELT